MKKPAFIFPLLLAWASGCALDTVNRPELLISPIDDEDPSGLSAVLLENDVAHERSFSFSLYLTRKPSSDVTVRISSDISGEVSILDEVRVFTPENYDMIQSVRVAGMMDSRVDGDCPVGILFDMSSEDGRIRWQASGTKSVGHGLIRSASS
ncbi:MAG: hypothetical protein IJ268_11185 [Proteobacteria bacterium]|nr:hypothetical protein [Pseudomonadota bacterium]